MTQTPRQVIEETISQASTFFVAQTEGGYGVILNPSDLKKLIEDLDAAESREQRLKEAAQKVVDHTEPITHLAAQLSTIYPDTPAPKEGEQ